MGSSTFRVRLCPSSRLEHPGWASASAMGSGGNECRENLMIQQRWSPEQDSSWGLPLLLLSPPAPPSPPSAPPPLPFPFLSPSALWQGGPPLMSLPPGSCQQPVTTSQPSGHPGQAEVPTLLDTSWCPQSLPITPGKTPQAARVLSTVPAPCPPTTTAPSHLWAPQCSDPSFLAVPAWTGSFCPGHGPLLSLTPDLPVQM